MLLQSNDALYRCGDAVAQRMCCASDIARPEQERDCKLTAFRDKTSCSTIEWSLIYQTTPRRFGHTTRSRRWLGIIISTAGESHKGENERTHGRCRHWPALTLKEPQTVKASVRVEDLGYKSYCPGLTTNVFAGMYRADLSVEEIIRKGRDRE